MAIMYCNDDPEAGGNGDWCIRYTDEDWKIDVLAQCCIDCNDCFWIVPGTALED